MLWVEYADVHSETHVLRKSNSEHVLSINYVVGAVQDPTVQWETHNYYL